MFWKLGNDNGKHAKLRAHNTTCSTAYVCMYISAQKSWTLLFLIPMLHIYFIIQRYIIY